MTFGCGARIQDGAMTELIIWSFIYQGRFVTTGQPKNPNRAIVLMASTERAISVKDAREQEGRLNETQNPAAYQRLENRFQACREAPLPNNRPESKERRGKEMILYHYGLFIATALFALLVIGFFIIDWIMRK